MTTELTINYMLYIATTPESLWDALTNPDRTTEYWQHRNISDWQPGATWEHQLLDESHTVDIYGVIVECVPSQRLVHTWSFPNTPGAPVSGRVRDRAGSHGCAAHPHPPRHHGRSGISEHGGRLG